MALVVAIQGEGGSYSEEAAHRFYGEDIRVLPTETLRDTFDALQAGAAQAMAVPAENSRAGTVVETYDLLLERGIEVLGALDVPIHHCLLAPPGTPLAAITSVTSHPQALRQCSRYLKQLGARPVPAADTAGSARRVAEERPPGMAAVASRRAARLYGLTILKESIQDTKTNITRFYAAGRPPLKTGLTGQTILTFGLENRPGALVRCLMAFAEQGVNLSKLESRPLAGRPFEYAFFAVLDARAEEAAVQASLRALASRSTFRRILGSF